jgi:hypothetical protein
MRIAFENVTMRPLRHHYVKNFSYTQPILLPYVNFPHRFQPTHNDVSAGLAYQSVVE